MDSRYAYGHGGKPAKGGAQPFVVDRVAYETQHLVHGVGIQKSLTDARHSLHLPHRFPEGLYMGEKLTGMVFSSKYPPWFDGEMGRSVPNTISQAFKDALARPERLEREQMYWDKVGTLHLDRCWNEQGHDRVSPSSLPLDPSSSFPQLTPSADLMGNCVYRSMMTSRYMIGANLYLQAIFTPYFMACGAEEYSDFRRTFRATSLTKEEEETYGFHTGQAIVYNDVVHQHLDAHDSGLCFTFCTGSFEGGYMYFPDLDMAFR